MPDTGEIGRVLQSASLLQCFNAFGTARQSPRRFERRDGRRFKVKHGAGVNILVESSMYFYRSLYLLSTYDW